MGRKRRAPITSDAISAALRSFSKRQPKLIDAEKYASGYLSLRSLIRDRTDATLTTTNDFASKTIGTVSGGSAFSGLTASPPIKDANAQNTRESLVAQYNTVIDQIKTTASDASFNGVNLLNGDTLALTFNERGCWQIYQLLRRALPGWTIPR